MNNHEIIKKFLRKYKYLPYYGLLKNGMIEIIKPQSVNEVVTFEFIKEKVGGLKC